MDRLDKIIIALILISIFLASWCVVSLLSKENSNIGDTLTKVDTVYTTKVDSTPIKIGDADLVHQTETIYYPEFKNITVDTGAIVRSFLSCKTSYYNYRKDSLYNLVIADSFCLGQLLSRNIEFKSLKPDSTVYITTTITNYEREKAKGRLYLGLQTSRFNPIAPAVLYTHKRIGINASYGLYNRQAEFGLYYLLK
jgi:hypothetical protein